MLSRNKKILAFGLAAALASGVAFAAVVYGGAVTVAATDPHYAPVEWALKTTMRSSVQNHAADIEVPAGLDLRDPAQAERAFGHYSVACTPCHGAPGVEAAPWLVLNPPAEPLVDTADRWTDAELYWIVKHGIKMTGMPALGPTHQDDDLWAIAAFVRQLPDMSVQTYAQMGERHAAKMQVAMGGPHVAPEPEPEPEPDASTQSVEAAADVSPAGQAAAAAKATAATNAATPKPRARTPERKPRNASAEPAQPSAEPSPSAEHGGHAHHHH